MPRLHSELKALYIDILSCFMKEDYWRHSPIPPIDPTSHDNMVPLANMYKGTKVALLLSENKAQDVKYFLRVHEYYIEAASQIK